MPASAAKTDLDYLENRFDYQFTKHGERDLKKLSQKELGKVIERVEGLKENTWHEIVNMPREKGLTPERVQGTAYEKTTGRAETSHQNIYPFHLRVPSISKRFRVFGYQYQNTFYITQIDKNHSQHKQK